jgi:hypothetical protein
MGHRGKVAISMALLGKTEQNPRFYGENSRFEQFWVKSGFEDMN